MHNALHTILYQAYVFELLFCIALHCVRLWEPSICIWVLPVFGELGGTSVMKSPPPCLARSQDDGDDGDEVDVVSGKHDGVELSADADDAVAQLNLQLST